VNRGLNAFPGIEKNEYGFSLMELIVVMVIVGILATGVVFMFADPTAKVKAAAFEMRGDFNLARGEAVTENENVLITFDTGANDGYRICFETTGDDDCYDEAGDDVIKDVIFNDSVTYYDFTGPIPLPGDGPDKAPAVGGVETDLTGKSGITLQINGNGLPYIYFIPNGTCEPLNGAGAVIVYLSQQGNPSVIRGNPYAVVVGSTSTGWVFMERWRPELGASGEWYRK
jgi:prepilin-type N-terminal cleavage/methylation domain-containing protein